MRCLMGSRHTIHIIAEYIYIYALNVLHHCIRSIEPTLRSVALVGCVDLRIRVTP